MYPLRSLLTDQQFLQTFNACVASKCNYMSLLWGNANRKNCKVIERKIRQSARIILRKSWQDPISSDIRSFLKWFLPHDLYLFFLMCFTYQIIHKSRPTYFPNVFKYVEDVHTHETRSRKNLFISNSRANEYGKRFILNCPSMKWNELTDEMRNVPSLNIFRI
jgi:hypothetical protein